MGNVVTFTKEQFAELLTTLKPSSIVCPSKPSAEEVDQRLALEIFNVLGRVWGDPTDFTKQIHEMCKAKL